MAEQLVTATTDPGELVSGPDEHGKFWVICGVPSDPEHRNIERAVDTSEHAFNLARKHLREYHGRIHHAADAALATSTDPWASPVQLGDLQLDLSGPATLAAMAYSLPPGVEVAAGFIAMWEALTGRTGRQGEELAKAVQAQRQPVTAAVVPF